MEFLIHHLLQRKSFCHNCLESQKEPVSQIKFLQSESNFPPTQCHLLLSLHTHLETTPPRTQQTSEKLTPQNGCTSQVNPERKQERRSCGDQLPIPEDGVSLQGPSNPKDGTGQTLGWGVVSTKMLAIDFITLTLYSQSLKLTSKCIPNKYSRFQRVVMGKNPSCHMYVYTSEGNKYIF